MTVVRVVHTEEQVDREAEVIKRFIREEKKPVEIEWRALIE